MCPLSDDVTGQPREMSASADLQRPLYSQQPPFDRLSFSSAATPSSAAQETAEGQAPSRQAIHPFTCHIIRCCCHTLTRPFGNISTSTCQNRTYHEIAELNAADAHPAELLATLVLVHARKSLSNINQSLALYLQLQSRDGHPLTESGAL